MDDSRHYSRNWFSGFLSEKTTGNHENWLKTHLYNDPIYLTLRVVFENSQQVGIYAWVSKDDFSKIVLQAVFQINAIWNTQLNNIGVD